MLTHARQGSDETRSVSRRRFHARTHAAFRAEEFDGRVEVVVGTITANRETWLATMMDEELHLQPVQAPDIMRSAIVITVATLIGHLIPLLPLVWLSRTHGAGHRDRAERSCAVRGWGLRVGDPGRGLAQEWPEDGRERAGRGRGRVPDRPTVPHHRSMTRVIDVPASPSATASRTFFARDCQPIRVAHEQDHLGWSGC